MTAFSVVLIVVVFAAVAVFILLFERRRARQIEQDLRDQYDRQGRRPPEG
ncbi:MAG TPA: hypothetical protein VFV89_08275 [Nocardioides sp.]|nr:hypothetical protein [Nocardioides sp.]HEX5087790.1 hypothetical protein [Nocardioides sp.]